MIGFCGAKINIGLRVLSKRADGLHNIASVFYPIPFTEVLEVIAAEAFSYQVKGICVPCEVDQNTCVRAWLLCKRAFPHLGEITIFHHKCIPIGSGLGGGSANAALVLQLVKEMFSLPLCTEKMEHILQEIGSDCTFFLHNRPAFVSGTGHRIHPIALDLSSYDLLLVLPKDIHICTADAYAQIQPQQKDCTDLEGLHQGDIHKWKEYVNNDFEPLVCRAHPILQDYKRQLYTQGALFASLSGTGSTVYGLFPKGQKRVMTFPHCTTKWFSLST